jgi:hypothetical protein
VALTGTAFVVGLTATTYPLLVGVENGEPGPGGIVLALLSHVFPSVIGLGLLAAGAAVAAGRRASDFAMALGGVCAALFVGAANAALYSHAVAPITADGRWARLTVLTVLSGGIGLTGAGVLRIRQSARTMDQSSPDAITTTTAHSANQATPHQGVGPAHP